MINFLANPERFMRFSKVAIPIFAILAFLSLVFGYIWSLVYAPADYQQSQTARIIFIHVPSAWVAVGAYSTMALGSLVFLVWRHNLADLAAKAAAHIGVVFTALCLITGSIWGRPTWGTWWEWDEKSQFRTPVRVDIRQFMAWFELRSKKS